MTCVHKKWIIELVMESLRNCTFFFHFCRLILQQYYKSYLCRYRFHRLHRFTNDERPRGRPRPRLVLHRPNVIAIDVHKNSRRRSFVWISQQSSASSTMDRYFDGKPRKMAEKTRRGYVFFYLFIWIFHIRYSVRSTGSTIRFSSAGGDLEYDKYKKIALKNLFFI